MRRLVILRPEPGAGMTVTRARAIGVDAVAVPLFAVQPVTWTIPAGPFDAVLLTSANAVRHGGEQLLVLRDLPIHAVGDATAAAAREAGFVIASSGDAGVDRLLGSIDPALKLLHLCGADRTAPTHPRQAITAVTVYRSVALPDPPLETFAGAVVAVHSARAAGRLAALQLERSAIDLIAISATVARGAGAGWRSVCAAESPAEDALLALAKQLCDTEPRP